MNDKRAWLAYLFFGVAVAIFFLYYLFPAEIAKSYAVNQVSRIFPRLQARIEQAQLIFPLGMRLENVALYRQSDALLEADRITIKPGLLALIVGRKSIDFKIEASGGLIVGNAYLKSDEIVLNSDLDKIRLEEIPALQYVMSHGLSGNLSGKLNFRSASVNRQNAIARINVTYSTVQLAEPFLNIDSLTFDSVTAEAKLQNRQVELTRCVFKGEELNGNLAGTGLLKPDLINSTLNLSGRILPNQALLQSVGGDSAAVFLKGAGKGGFPIKITGPVNNPKVSFN